MKKWTVLIAGIILQAILGGVYAWSEFVPSLKSDYGFSQGQAGLIFGSTIGMFTVFMIPSGRLLHKFSPRVIATFGALLYASGYLLASFSDGNYTLIFIGISIISGMGIGAGYVCPLTVGMKWFPNNKGLITGVAVAGFGGGAIALSNISQHLIHNLHWNVLEVFRFIGLALGGIAVIAALFLQEPITEKSDSDTNDKTNLDINKFTFSKTFILLCVGMFAGTFAGLLTIGNLKSILLNLELGEKIATLGISIFAIGNAAGRIIWGQIHDKLCVRKTILLSLLFLAFSILPLAFNLPSGLQLIAVGFIGINFGACFVVYASSTVKFYGTELFPKMYPVCFLAYGLAGIIGPAAGGWIADATGSFKVGIFLSVAIVLAAFAVNAFALPNPQNAKE